MYLVSCIMHHVSCIMYRTLYWMGCCKYHLRRIQLHFIVFAKSKTNEYSKNWLHKLCYQHVAGTKPFSGYIDLAHKSIPLIREASRTTLKSFKDSRIWMRKVSRFGSLRNDLSSYIEAVTGVLLIIFTHLCSTLSLQENKGGNHELQFKIRDRLRESLR